MEPIVDHIRITVKDLSEAEAFYGRLMPLLGLNLRRFFARRGAAVPVSTVGADYRPGDLVTWLLPGNLPHIGILSERLATDGRPLIIHNIGAGPKLEDVLFKFEITGHYRYPGP